MYTIFHSLCISVRLRLEDVRHYQQRHFCDVCNRTLHLACRITSCARKRPPTVPQSDMALLDGFLKILPQHCVSIIFTLTHAHLILTNMSLGQFCLTYNLTTQYAYILMLWACTNICTHPIDRTNLLLILEVTTSNI